MSWFYNPFSGISNDASGVVSYFDVYGGFVFLFVILIIVMIVSVYAIMR